MENQNKFKDFIKNFPRKYSNIIKSYNITGTKEQALNKGYSWKEPEERNYQIDLKTEDLPDHIKEAKDDIINQIIECAHQGKCNE